MKVFNSVNEIPKDAVVLRSKTNSNMYLKYLGLKDATGKSLYHLGEGLDFVGLFAAADVKKLEESGEITQLEAIKYTLVMPNDGSMN